MFAAADTIVAIATPPGRGGIGVVRISGPEAHRIGRELTARTRSLQPRYATFVTISHRSSNRGSPSSSSSEIDQAIVTYFPAPASYTGDDVVEISAHGSPVVLTAI